MYIIRHLLQKSHEQLQNTVNENNPKYPEIKIRPFAGALNDYVLLLIKDIYCSHVLQRKRSLLESQHGIFLPEQRQ